MATLDARFVAVEGGPEDVVLWKFLQPLRGFTFCRRCCLDELRLRGNHEERESFGSRLFPIRTDS